MTSAECSPGTTFISLAPSRSLCFKSIFYVALILIFDLSGSMNTLVEGWPEFSKALMSRLAVAPDVAPVPMIPVWRFEFFCAHFAAILFVGKMMQLLTLLQFFLLGGDGNSLPFPVHWLDRLAVTNSSNDCKPGVDLVYLLLPLLLLSPVPVRLMPPCLISNLPIACPC